MAVPKKKKSSSATKRQRNAYVISQHKKILKMVDARIRVEKNLEKWVPKKHKIDAHHLLILHGRYTCIARKPRCQSCVIENLCEFKDKTES